MDYGRPPVLTEEERRVNTEKAIAARHRRAEVKQQLHDGKISLEDVLSMKDDPVVNRMKIEELIRALPASPRQRRSWRSWRLHRTEG